MTDVPDTRFVTGNVTDVHGPGWLLLDVGSRECYAGLDIIFAGSIDVPSAQFNLINLLEII